MSSANAMASPLQAGRRSHLRRRIDGLAYVEFGPDNGAILIDVGEGGLGFQSVMPVSMNQALLFKFKLPGAAAYLEGFGEVAWMNESGKGGGLRFVDVNEATSSQIREWTAALSTSDSADVANDKDGGPELTAEVPAEGAIQAKPGAKPDATPPALADEASAKAELLTAIISEAAPIAEVAELPSTEPSEIASTRPELQSAPPPDQSSTKQTPALQSPLPALSIPEFTIEAMPAPASSDSLAIPSEPAQISLQSVILPFSLDSGLDGALAPPSNKQSETIVARSTTPAKPPVVPAPDSRLDAKLDSQNLVSVKKSQQKRLAPKTVSPAVTAHRQEPIVGESFARQPQKAAPTGGEWENFIANHAADSIPHSALAPALKAVIGAAAGACLVLALVFGVPYLKTQVEATANAKPANSILGNSSTFEVEVADITNRRWVLRSGGSAGSPFGDAVSKRDAQSVASGVSRKSSRLDDSDNAVETVVEAPQPKLARPGELALPRPRATQNGAPSLQLTAPSIFDGITPPIGSVADRLATGGPEAPGIVAPESESTVKKSVLQAAVLVQRVSPLYPIAAAQSQVQGEVLVDATIGKDGIPRNLKVVKGDQRLTAAALAAIGQWRYRPATLAGESIETQIEITVDFHLK